MSERATTGAAPRFVLRRSLVESAFAADVARGLRARPKHLPPWYFYDALGSALFSAICELPEYYVTRTEAEILRGAASEMARAFRQPDRVVELGSGDGRKTRLLIEALLAQQPKLTYTPVDVDPSVLEAASRTLLNDFPSLRVEAVCADYRDAARLLGSNGRTAVLFLGSSIGNHDAQSATIWLRDLRRMLGRGDVFLLGADLQKPKEIVEPAYNDSLGVTAAFNLNVLARMNRELGAHFDVAAFEHRAFLNQQESRIEMHLVSRARQTVRIDALDLQVDFEKGETIHTENSYKYSRAHLQALADDSGFAIEQVWTDRQGWFADLLMTAR